MTYLYDSGQMEHFDEKRGDEHVDSSELIAITIFSFITIASSPITV